MAIIGWDYGDDTPNDAYYDDFNRRFVKVRAPGGPTASKDAAAYDLTKRTGKVRTDLHCHQCSNDFIASLDYDVDGSHVVECPYCGHEHCRVISGGVVTEERFGSRADRVNVAKRDVWKKDGMETRTVSAFLRDRWLNRSDGGSSSD